MVGVQRLTDECLGLTGSGNDGAVDAIEVVDGVFRLSDVREDPVQVMWRLENEARIHQSRDAR